MRFPPSSALVLGLATTATVVDAQAQYLINELSFGYNGLYVPHARFVRALLLGPRSWSRLAHPGGPLTRDPVVSLPL